MVIQPFDRRAYRAYLELDVFSGVPNPRWPIDERDAKEILAEVKSLPERRLSVRERDLWEPVSGYGGILLHYVNPKGQWEAVTFYRELIAEGDAGPMWVDAGHRLEGRLFATLPRELAPLIDNESFETLNAEVNEDKDIEGVDSGTGPACGAAKAFPPPQKWLTPPGKRDNRCYNYANDVFTNDTAVPGAAIHFDLTDNELHALLVSDGLVPVAPDRKKLPAVCHVNGGAHLIAAAQRKKNAGTKMENGVAVPTFRDFHFLRFDAAGVWSHKDGIKLPRNTDNKGNPLLDLQAAKFKLKHFWVGYYWTFPGPHRRISHP